MIKCFLTVSLLITSLPEAVFLTSRDSLPLGWSCSLSPRFPIAANWEGLRKNEATAQCVVRRVAPPTGELLWVGQGKHSPAAVLADKRNPQSTTQAPRFGSTPENLETMLGKTLNQSRAGQKMKNCQNTGIGLGTVRINLPFCYGFENRIWKQCQSTGKGIQGQVLHPTY